MSVAYLVVCPMDGNPLCPQWPEHRLQYRTQETTWRKTAEQHLRDYSRQLPVKDNRRTLMRYDVAYVDVADHVSIVEYLRSHGFNTLNGAWGHALTAKDLDVWPAHNPIAVIDWAGTLP